MARGSLELEGGCRGAWRSTRRRRRTYTEANGPLAGRASRRTQAAACRTPFTVRVTGEQQGSTRRRTAARTRSGRLRGHGPQALKRSPGMSCAAVTRMDRPRIFLPAFVVTLTLPACHGSVEWPDPLAYDGGDYVAPLCQNDAGGFEGDLGSCNGSSCPAGSYCEPTELPQQSTCRPPPGDAACFVPSCGSLRCACTCQAGDCRC